jgi:ABC-2 type transport system permease protein
MKLLNQEWKKLIGSGQSLALLLTAFLVGVVLTVFDGVSILGDPTNALDAARVTDTFTGTIYLAWVFPPILGVLMVTSEFRLGTAIATFLLTPNRTRVLASKMLIGGVGGALTGAVSMLGAFATAFAIIQTAPESVGPAPERLAGAVLGMVTTGFALGMLGVAVGALIRAQLASLAVLLGWLLFIEGVIVGVIGEAGIVLPGQLVLYSVSAPGDGTWLTQVIQGNITAFVGFLGIIAWAIIVGAVASLTTMRKDID